MKIILPKEIKLPKEINIDVDINTCKHNLDQGSNKDREELSKVFSGEDFKI